MPNQSQQFKVNNYLIYFALISIITSSCNIPVIKDTLLTGLLKRETTNRLLLDSIRQNLYKNNLDISDSLVNMIDSLTLSKNEKGDYYLTKGFLYHKEGKINNSVVYLNILKFRK